MSSSTLSADVDEMLRQLLRFTFGSQVAITGYTVASHHSDYVVVLARLQPYWLLEISVLKKPADVASSQYEPPQVV